MQPVNMLNFVKGGGGLIGKGKTCRLDNFKVVVHSLEKKDKSTGAVIERFPAACFVAFDINVLDEGVDDEHRKATQYLQVGRVPLWYAQQINSLDPQRDPNFSGGFLPSTDNQNPSTEGPFFIADGEQGVYEGADYSIFLGELINLGFRDQNGEERMAKQGVACLNGIVVKIDEKAKPKGKKSDPTKAARTVLVPVQVIQWPWQASAGVAASAPAAIAKPAVAVAGVAPIAAPSIAAPSPIAPPPVVGNAVGGNGTNYDEIAIARIKKAALASGGMLKADAILSSVFPLTGDLDGVTKSQVMTRVNTPTFIQAAAAAGHFLIDASGTIMVASA